ncbi:MAG: YDG domain-containing protein, partial [Verrucomicrobiota bacterium]
MTVAAPALAVAGQQLHGHVPAAVAAVRPVERLPAAQRVNLAIGLPLRNPDKLKSLIADLYDPANPNYRHYLTPAQFTERFGPSEADYQAVADFAQANGLTVTVTHPNRLILDVEGSIVDIEKTFHVTMRSYPHPREGRKFFAPDAEPSLDLAVPVLHISGLDNYSIPKPNHKIKPLGATAKATPNAGSAPGGAYAGNDFRAAYVPGTALTGTGQSVGLLQFDGYYASDITAYKTQFGLPNVPLINVAVDGGVSTPGTGNGEVCLDIEMVLAMSPGVSAIYVYMAPNPSPWVDLLNRMATDNLSKQLSCSWGGGGTNPSAEAIFQQMATQGQSFFNATGDSDAFTGSITFPSDSPNITEVGGTTLTTSGAGGAFVSEKVWNWGLQGTSYVGSSGGSSTYYAIPSWQQTTSMATNQGSTTKRNVPDVALTGDNVYVTYHNGTTATTGVFGGTSCAAPLWAGFTALVNQQAATNGRASVGFLNPALYAIGSGASYTSTFHDTTTGNNFNSSSPSKFSAVTGYDLCTGWGTPNGTSLINALAGAVENLQVSAPAFAAVGNAGGPFTPISVSFTLTNSGATSLNWSAATTQPWMSLSASSGTLAPGANTTVAWSITSDANTLTAGSYADTVTFTNGNSGVAQNFGMSLAVTGPPTNLVAAPGNNTARLTWSASSGATGYNVKRSLTSGGPYATVGTATGTSYMDSAVTNGTAYYYVVSATSSGGGESPNSGEASVIPMALPSTTSLASSLGTPGTYGTTVTFTATVTGSGSTATGSITFKDGTAVLGTAPLLGSGTATFSTSALAVGGHALTAIYPGDVTYTGSNSSAFGYTVNPKTVTISGVTSANKIYDATPTAVLTGGVVSGLVGSDVVTVVAGSGTFASANAGSQSVSTTGYAIGGANAVNYVLSAQPVVANATITPRPIQVTGTRAYDGTTAAPAGSMVVSNSLDGTNLTVTGSANLAGRNVGSQAVAIGATLARVQSATGNTGSSTQTSFSVTLGNTPVAGNTLIAVISTRGTSANRVTGIAQTGTVTWSRASQATNTNGTTTEIWYAPNVSGAGKVVTISQASLRSAAVVIEYAGILDASPLDQTASATGSSTAPVTGTTAATTQANELWIAGIGFISSTPSLGTFLNSFSSVASAQSTSNRPSSNNAEVYALERLVNPSGAAASGGTLSVSAQWSGTLATFRTELPSTLATAGPAAGNYTVTGISGAVSVTPKALTVTAVPASKTYDGTTTASGTPTLTPTLVSGDTPGVLSQAFQTSGVGTGNKVIIPSLGINDGNGGANYAVTPVNCTTGTILPAAAGVVLGNLAPTYDGSPKPVAVTTTPSGLAVTVSYDGSATVPSATGSYAVVATVTDPNYTGTAAGTLVIQKAAATIGLSGLTQTYDGAPKAVTATPTPA